MTFYNLIFTAFPLGIKALFDRDAHHTDLVELDDGTPAMVDHTLIEYLNPLFYRRGQQNESFNNTTFTIWMLKGILHAFIIWLTSTFSQGSGIISKDGYNAEYYFQCITMFTTIFLVDRCSCRLQLS